MHTARFWMASAIPGGAPGYDDDKQFGNFITHMTARTSQRLREHTVQARKVKRRAASALKPELNRVFRLRRVRILPVSAMRMATSRHCERSEAIHRHANGGNGLLRRVAPRNDGLNAGECLLQPRSRRFRLHPFKFRQLVPEPG